MWPFSSTTISDPQRMTPASGPPARLLEMNYSSSIQPSPVNMPDPTLPEPEVLQLTGMSGERLGIPGILRIPVLMAASGFCGFALGAAQGGPIAADRYRAENAHRFPTTRSGWFLYHKTKNYHMIIGSMKEGAKFGFKLMGWATLFGVTEEMVDRSRARLFALRSEDEDRISGQRDVLSTVMAALTVAGAYSWRSGFDQFAAARMSKVALRYSLMYGLAQDTLASLRGDPPGYIAWIMRKTIGTSREIDTT